MFAATEWPRPSSAFDDGPAVLPPLQFADLHADLQRVPLVVVVDHVVAAGVADDVLTARPACRVQHGGSAAVEQRHAGAVDIGPGEVAGATDLDVVCRRDDEAA